MLFDEYKLKNLTLRNRILMAPMTRNQSPGGIPTDEVVSYYSRRAKAEVGITIKRKKIILNIVLILNLLYFIMIKIKKVD